MMGVYGLTDLLTFCSMMPEDMFLVKPPHPAPVRTVTNAEAMRIGRCASGIETWTIMVWKVTSSYNNHRLGARHLAQLGLDVEIVVDWVHVDCLGTSGKDCRWETSLTVSRGDVDVFEVWVEDVCDEADMECASSKEMGPIPRKLDGLGPWSLTSNWSGFVLLRVSIQRLVDDASVL